jgi:hypothetical protein
MGDHLLGGRWLRLGLEILHDHLARKHPLKRLDRWCGPRLLFLLSRSTCDLCRCWRSRLLAELSLPFPRVARTRAGGGSSGGDPTGDEWSRGNRLLLLRCGLGFRTAIGLAFLRRRYGSRWTRGTADDGEGWLTRRVLRAGCPSRKEGTTSARCMRAGCTCSVWSRGTVSGTFGSLRPWSRGLATRSRGLELSLLSRTRSIFYPFLPTRFSPCTMSRENQTTSHTDFHI